MEIDKNRRALEKASLAQITLNEIKGDSDLIHAHSPMLTRLGISKHMGQFVRETATEIMDIYGTCNYDEIVGVKEIPFAVQNFVEDYYDYDYDYGRNK